jgi:hypothetical protein
MVTSGTALVLIFTQQGFVFAADGLEQDVSGKTVTNSAQKIFQAGKCVAFSCAGFRSIRNEDTGETKFELPGTMYEAFEQAIKSFSGDFENLAGNVAEKVLAKFVELKENKIIETYPKNEYSDWFARILLAGFFGDKPGAAQLSFRCPEEGAVSQVETANAPGFFAYAGSDKVWKALLDNSDAKLATYRKDAFDKMRSLYGPNLDEATLIAQSFIRACSDPAVQEAYPECKSIGGNMQSSTITSEIGFNWIPV